MGTQRRRSPKARMVLYMVLPPTTTANGLLMKTKGTRTSLLMAESLEKGYDRFQKLLSQLDALGASVSDEDANHKFLRSLPPAWDSLAMTMRTKKNIDTLSIDDLYNNLSVFEQDIQKTSSSSLTSDNVAFLSQAKASSSKHKPSHNSGSYSSYTTSSSKATPTATPGLADEVIHSFLATNADDVDLIHEDLDQIDDLDLEEMDINWQIAMTAIKIKKFYKKTGRRPRVDGKMHVAFDKRKVECFNCHNTGHFARECKFKGTKDGSRQEASRGQDFKPVRTEKEALMTIDEGQINWVEQTTDEELNHALMAFTVNNEVSMCSKLCLDSFNALKDKYDELQSEFGDQEAALTAHKIGLKKVEAQLRASHKQQISLNEKLHFQANQIFEKDEKLKKYRRIGMKAVKDKDALQKIVDSWFASSKNLWKLIDCGMSSTVKLGLGYSIKSNAEVLSYEEEMDRGIFASIRETDPGYHDIPLYSRFKQVEYKGVPHPLSGDYTPREQEDIDDSLYEYGKYGPQPQTPSPTVSNASSISFSICPSNDSDGDLGTVSGVSSTHYSTCQSNDSVGEPGTVSDHSVNDDSILVPTSEQVSITTQKTQSQVPTPPQTVDPSCAQHVKTPRQPIRTPVTPSPIPSYNRQNWNQRMERDLGAGYSFERKPCFVCGSLSHLIKDCDYYEKKMAREAALKSKRVVHADVRQATPAWTNTNRVNKANQFTPRPVQLSNIRPNLSTASKTIKTGRVNVNTGHGNVSTVSSAGTQIKSGSSRFNTGKLNVNSGSVHVNSARVTRPVSNQTSYKSSPKFSQDPSTEAYGGQEVFDSDVIWAHDWSLNFKNLNKLVKGNLVRGLPSKSFKNDHTCVACQKGKQHKASSKKDGGLVAFHKDFYKTGYKTNLIKKKKSLDSDNGTEFKNRVMLEFCGEKGIKQEFSNARTPQQNGVAERMNRTLIEAARTMLADSHLPTTFWAEAGSKYRNAYLQLGKELPISNKTPYELLFGPQTILSLHKTIWTEEAAELMVVSSTSLTEATRKAAVSEKIAKKKTHSPKQPSSTPISNSADDIMTLENELDLFLRST
ncbi:ribonuclease H-like domain-containing protein [Tanacetum coccineum]